jgi:hypothetical protein
MVVWKAVFLFAGLLQLSDVGVNGSDGGAQISSQSQNGIDDMYVLFLHSISGFFT